MLELAKAYGIACRVNSSDPQLSAKYAKECVACLREAVFRGFRDFFLLQRDEDLDSLRDTVEFKDFMVRVLGGVRYSSVRRVTEDIEVTTLPSQGTRQIQEYAHRLDARGFRPLVHAAVAAEDGEQNLATALWYRPRSLEAESQRDLRRRTNAAIALLRLGESEVWQLLDGNEPDLATSIIHTAQLSGLAFSRVLQRLENEQDPHIQQSLVQLMGEYDFDSANPDAISRLRELCSSTSSPGVHSAAEWTLRAWGQTDAVVLAIEESQARQQGATRPWRIDPSGITMVRLEMPESPGQTKHRFEISTKEITRSQMKSLFQQLGRSDALSLRVAPDYECPQISVTWFDAARFCRWLSEQNGVSEEQMCYPGLSRIQVGMLVPSDFMQRTGYRLPTEKEWAFACRALTVTRRFHGDDVQHVKYYGWSQANSMGITWPVGSLKPNPFGLFDVYGNVWEWCHDRADLPWIFAALGMQAEVVSDDNNRILRGGSYYNPEFHLQTSMRISNRPSFLSEDYGFRVVRTIIPE